MIDFLYFVIIAIFATLFFEVIQKIINLIFNIKDEVSSHPNQDTPAKVNQSSIPNKIDVKKGEIIDKYNFSDEELYAVDNWSRETLNSLYNLPFLNTLLTTKKISEIYYPDLLSLFEWRSKRLKILIRDSFKCVDCLKTISKSNHVHHEYYIKDRFPWDIEDEALVTLCPPCHRKRHESYEPPVYEIQGSSRVRVSYEKPFCNRCYGIGYFPEYSHVDDGICFKCEGNSVTRKIFEKPLIRINNSLESYNTNEIERNFSAYLNQITPKDFFEKVPNANSYISRYESDLDDLPF